MYHNWHFRMSSMDPSHFSHLYQPDTSSLWALFSLLSILGSGMVPSLLGGDRVVLHRLSLASHPPLPPRALEPLPATNPSHLQPRPPHGLDHLSLLRHSLFGYPFAPLLLPLLRHLPQALPFPASSHPLVYIVKPGRCTQSHTRPDRGAHTLTHNRQRWWRQQLGDSSDGGSHRYAPPSGGGRRGQTGEFPHP